MNRRKIRNASGLVNTYSSKLGYCLLVICFSLLIFVHKDRLYHTATCNTFLQELRCQ
uniref:Transmembrane protein n=1 Tax=Arabidopsis thaliana TaxID=3702 RepID=Q0WVZ4_ARATH|nr:hypothetical protein [Arabidopsis thaliana]